jgi:BMFP domain-containing protein YqiC
MQAREKILDDVARVAGGAVSAFSGLRRQIKDEVRVRIDEFAQRLDLVPREDFERVELMMFKAREEQTRLNERVAALEAKLAGAKQTAKAKQTSRKPKTAKKK